MVVVVVDHDDDDDDDDDVVVVVVVGLFVLCLFVCLFIFLLLILFLLFIFARLPLVGFSSFVPFHFSLLFVLIFFPCVSSSMQRCTRRSENEAGACCCRFSIFQTGNDGSYE